MLCDGRATQPGDDDESFDAAIAEAEIAASMDVTIHTITLGSEEGIELMSRVAEITGGTHTFVADDVGLNELRANLEDAFTDALLPSDDSPQLVR